MLKTWQARGGCWGPPGSRWKTQGSAWRPAPAQPEGSTLPASWYSGQLKRTHLVANTVQQCFRIGSVILVKLIVIYIIQHVHSSKENKTNRLLFMVNKLCCGFFGKKPISSLHSKQTEWSLLRKQTLCSHSTYKRPLVRLVQLILYLNINMGVYVLLLIFLSGPPSSLPTPLWDLLLLLLVDRAREKLWIGGEGRTRQYRTSLLEFA